MNEFAIMDITYDHLPTTVTITVTTNTPVNLTLHITKVEPVRHKDGRILRGLAIPWGAYFCFVAWVTIPQLEPGDTLTHTFIVPDWLFCQWRYFIFTGTIAGITSPSISPIFAHHNPIPPYSLFQHYNMGETSAYRFTSNTLVAQTFTVQNPHSIAQVILMLNRKGLPGLITASIRSTDLLGHPTGADLTSATFNGNALIPFPGKEWKTIPLPFYPLLAAKYAILLHAPFGSVGNDIGWWGDAASPTYLLGNFERGVAPGIGWAAILTRDAMFEEWGFQY